MNITDSIPRLSEYGYSLNPDGFFITPGGKTTQVRLVARLNRLRAVGSGSSGLLWSGSDVGKFLESFWFAKRQQP